MSCESYSTLLLSVWSFSERLVCLGETANRHQYWCVTYYVNVSVQNNISQITSLHRAEETNETKFFF